MIVVSNEYGNGRKRSLGSYLETRVCIRPMRSVIVVANESVLVIVIARVRMALSRSKGLNRQYEQTTDCFGLGDGVEVAPSDLASNAIGDIFKNGLCERRRPCAADDLVEIKLDVGEIDFLLFLDGVEPVEDVFHKLQHDGLSWLAHECPLTEGHAFAAEDGMIGISWLVDFDTDNHADVHFIDPFGQKTGDWSESLDVDVRVDAALDVHDEIAKEIGLDNVILQRSVRADNIGSINALWAKVALDVGDIVAIRQDLVSVVRVDICPAPRQIKVPALEGEGMRFPDLPDFSRKVARCQVWRTVEACEHVGENDKRHEKC